MILCVTLNPVVDTTMFVDEITPTYRINARRVNHVAGGKGNNVARALVALGEPVQVFQPLGGAAGRHQADLLEQEGIDLVPVWVPGDTRFVITIVDKDYQQQAFFAPAAHYTTDEAATIRRRFAAVVNGADAVCLCGSSPSPLLDELYPFMVREAARQGAITLLDTYGRALAVGLEAAPTIAKVNRAEAEGLLQRSIESRADQLDAIRKIQGYGCEWVILTLGAEGALGCHHHQGWIGRSTAVDVVNPIGSGDAMSAGLLAGIRRGLAPSECFRLGMAAAVANTTTWDACRFGELPVEGFVAHIELEPIQLGE